MKNPVTDDVNTLSMWLFKILFRRCIRLAFPGIFIHPENFKTLQDISYLSFTNVGEQLPPLKTQPSSAKATRPKKATKPKAVQPKRAKKSTPTKDVKPSKKLRRPKGRI